MPPSPTRQLSPDSEAVGSPGAASGLHVQAPVDDHFRVTGLNGNLVAAPNPTCGNSTADH